MTVHIFIILGIILSFYFGELFRSGVPHLSHIQMSSNIIPQDYSIRPLVETHTIPPHVRRSHSHSNMVGQSSDKRPEYLAIEALLQAPELFHKKTVTIRGIVSQPEMHLDETELFFDFVFLLKDGTQSIVVFGRHDRTQGGSPIAMGHTVEVTGVFWKDRIAHDYHFKNNLEAITITPYPSLTPDRT